MRRLLVLPPLLFLALAWLPAHFRINSVHRSMPRGVYTLHPFHPARGSIVLLCYPPGPTTLGLARGYHPPGRCPEGGLPVLKELAALPGDSVRPAPEGLYVNGVLLPRTARLLADTAGRPLPLPPCTACLVAPDTFWITSNYTLRSWDSRYFGPVSASQILATARPLLTEGSP